MNEFFDKIEAANGSVSWFFSIPSIGVGLLATALTLALLFWLRNRPKKDKDGNKTPASPLKQWELIFYVVVAAIVGFFAGSWHNANKAAQLARIEAIKEVAEIYEEDQTLEQEFYNVKFNGQITIETQDSVTLTILEQLEIRAPKISNRKVIFEPPPAMIAHARRIHNETTNKNPRAFCEIGLRGTSKIIWDWVYYPDEDYVLMEAPANYRQALDQGEFSMGRNRRWIDFTTEQVNYYEAPYEVFHFFQYLIGTKGMQEMFGVSYIAPIPDRLVCECYYAKPYGKYDTGRQFRNTTRSPDFDWGQLYNPYKGGVLEAMPRGDIIFENREKAEAAMELELFQ